MRIGIDARYAFGDDRGGIGEYVAALLEHLPAVSDGGDVFVAYVDHSADIEDLGDVRFELRRLPVPGAFLWKEVALPLAASRDRLDLLHLPGPAGPTWAPCPTVYTIYDPGQFVRAADGPRSGWQRLFGRVMRIGTLPIQAKTARRIITASDSSRLELTRLLGLEASRIQVIPPSVAQDLAPAASAALVREQLWQTGHTVPARFALAFADGDPGEAGRLLIRAFDRIRDLIPEFHLWIIGVDRPEAVPIPFPAHPEWLTILGHIPRRGLVGLLQAATVFVYLPERFGVPVLEAMSCGLPVLAPNRPDLAEAVGSAAVLFDPANEDDLAGGLVHLLTNDAIRSACIQAGRVHAGRFTEVEMVRRTYDVYRDALYEISREAAEGLTE